MSSYSSILKLLYYSLFRRISKEVAVTIYNSIFNKPIGYIYMFHRVAPEEGKLDVIDELRVSPEYFRKFIKERISGGVNSLIYSRLQIL